MKVIKIYVWWNNMRKYRKSNRTCSHNRFSLWLSSWAPQGRRWEACRTQSASGTRSGCRPSAERSGTAWSCCSGVQTNRWLKRYHGLQNTTDGICLCWTNTSWEALCWAETDGEVNSNKPQRRHRWVHIPHKACAIFVSILVTWCPAPGPRANL